MSRSDAARGLSPRHGSHGHAPGTVPETRLAQTRPGDCPGRVAFERLLRLELAPEGRLVEVVDEGAGAVDLDDRQPLAIGRLEPAVAGYVDLLVLEAELGTQPLELGSCPVAERAPGRVEQRDARDRARA
jgi:hypothetical protein